MAHLMRALVHDPDAPHGLRLGEATAPEPGPSEALVHVAATSLNFGEVAFLARHTEPGGVAGWDASGTVVAAAADGSGPPVDARVVTFGWSGAWAQLRAVSTGELAVLPDAVEFGAAATLPVAGVTALRAVRRLGSIVGRRVLITGASGGVGRFAVQLAARAGARVVAAVGSPVRGEGLSELGAREVVVGLGEMAGPVDAAIDNVGGQMLADVLMSLRPGGCVLSVGMASLQPTTIDFEQARQRVAGARVEPFAVGPGFGADLPYLVSLLEAGELDPQIGWRGPWDRAGEAAEALIGRRVRGKAVLEVAP
jgi:NADPH:quinone reductase-like Zn-dependent oxidoreductase